MGVGAGVLGNSGSDTGCFTGGGADGHDADGCLGFMGSGDAPTAYQQVVEFLGQQAAVGDGVVITGGEIVMTGAGTGGIMDVHSVIVESYGILKADTVLNLLRCKDVYTFQFPAFSDPDMGRHGNNGALREGF